MSAIIISFVGILVGIILIILMSYYGHPPLIIALIAAVIMYVCSGTNIQEGLVTLYSSGFGNAMANMFIMFLGCMTFGYVMDKAECAHAVARGYSLDNMARMMVSGCIGLDSMPNNGSLIAACDIIGTTMKKSYKPVFVTCTAVPIIAGLISVPLCSIF